MKKQATDLSIKNKSIEVNHHLFMHSFLNTITLKNEHELHTLLIATLCTISSVATMPTMQNKKQNEEYISKKVLKIFL